MQVLSTRASLIRTVHSFAVRDGFISLWSGLSASILRQSTYSTTRFALYDIFIHSMPSFSSSSNPSTSKSASIVCAGLAGGIAGVVGNPAEIVLVRMCADGAKQPSERFAYRNALSGLIRISVDEGFGAYFRGLGPNVVRSVLMNVSQIATYTEAKRKLLGMKQLGLKDDIRTHVLASFAAGTVATTVCAPADVIKSRFQSAPKTQGARRISVVEYVIGIVRREGPGVLMKGWTPAWLRLAPNTVLTFVFLEKLKTSIVGNTGKNGS
jgi:dicarboxylate transporter 10